MLNRELPITTNTTAFRSAIHPRNFGRGVSRIVVENKFRIYSSSFVHQPMLEEQRLMMNSLILPRVPGHIHEAASRIELYPHGRDRVLFCRHFLPTRPANVASAAGRGFTEPCGYQAGSSDRRSTIQSSIVRHSRRTASATSRARKEGDALTSRAGRRERQCSGSERRSRTPRAGMNVALSG
jgi:hypothetical protein